MFIIIAIHSISQNLLAIIIRFGCFFNALIHTNFTLRYTDAMKTKMKLKFSIIAVNGLRKAEENIQKRIKIKFLFYLYFDFVSLCPLFCTILICYPFGNIFSFFFSFSYFFASVIVFGLLHIKFIDGRLPVKILLKLIGYIQMVFYAIKMTVKHLNIWLQIFFCLNFIKIFIFFPYYSCNRIAIRL